MGAPDGVRPEYRKLVADLPLLASAFDCRLPAPVLRDVETFTLAMECVDRLLDGIADPTARRSFGAAVMAALEGPGPVGVGRPAARPVGAGPAARAGDGPGFTRELWARLSALREVIERRCVVERFCRLARHALSNTERIRTTRSRRRYVAAVEIEGRLTVELALTLLEGHCSGAFIGFFRSLAEPCNLYDKLRDARGDFRRGEIALRPGLRLHALLLAALLRRLPGAIRRHPRPDRLVTWGLGQLS